MASALWIDGTEHAPGDRAYFATDRGATLGDAVFDTCLCLNGQVVWKAEHLRRTIESAETFQHNFDSTLLAEAYEIAQRTLDPSVLRIVVSRGSSGRGLCLKTDTRSQITATLSPLPKDITFAHQALIQAEARRNETSLISKHKTAAYLDAILAQNRARACGFADAFFVNTQGNLTCTTLANLFLVMGSKLLTPRRADGVIGGVTRSKVLEAATLLGIEPVETRLCRSDLEQADEVFATNSLRLVIPAPNLGSGRREITQALSSCIVAGIEAECAFQLPLDGPSGRPKRDRTCASPWSCAGLPEEREGRYGI